MLLGVEFWAKWKQAPVRRTRCPGGIASREDRPPGLTGNTALLKQVPVSLTLERDNVQNGSFTNFFGTILN
jgi:hypothetical protein